MLGDFLSCICTLISFSWPHRGLQPGCRLEKLARHPCPRDRGRQVGGVWGEGEAAGEVNCRTGSR